ncbi:MAG: acetylxylan esterase [Planctomycetales bacterium]|nr:acetylxylan esterase [Planctomycetales bacterium]
MKCRVVIFVLLCSPTFLFAADVPPHPQTPAEVWAGFDPRGEPLEIEVTKTSVEDGVVNRELWFTGMTEGETKVRVYAIYAAPEGNAKHPAVLHIHGGGQTVAPAWLKFWAKRGYAVLSFNHGGKRPGTEKFTDWGKLTQGNQAEAGKMLMATEPSVRASSWYLWARVSRRALTALEQQPEVDPERMGIFGISVGGTLVWPVAAMDDRVKAACAIYGVGQTTYPQDTREPDLAATRPEILLWRKTMEPEEYAPLVKCPILFLNSTNDHHGLMDRSFDTLSRVKSPLRIAYTPRYRHHIGPEQEQDLPHWMDTWLKGESEWPKMPQVELSLAASRVPRLIVAPDKPADVKRVDIFYAVENTIGVNRFWRSAKTKRGSSGGPQDNNWLAELPILSVEQPLYAFANVHYVSGICLSSAMVKIIPKELSDVVVTDKPNDLIDDFSSGPGDWVTSSPATDPVPPMPNLVRIAEGPDKKSGITTAVPISLTTHKIGDPKWRGPTGSSLEFMVYAAAAKELEVIVHEKEFYLGHRPFKATRSLKPSETWQRLTFKASDFKDAKGEPLSEWSPIRMLELRTKPSAGAEPVYTEFRWSKE